MADSRTAFPASYWGEELVPDESQFPTFALDATTEEDLQTLAGFAEFWKIAYTIRSRSSANQVVVTSGKIPESTGTRFPIVISPSGDANAGKISDHFGVGLRTTSSLVYIPFSRTAETSIQTRIYNFANSKVNTIIESDGMPILSRLESTNIYLLSIDLVSSFARQISNGLEDPPSLKFRMATRLPFSYRMIPSFVRNRAFRNDDDDEAGKENVGPIECLRAVFLASLISATGAPIPFIGFWKRGKRFGAAVSHDVETGRGLDEGSKIMLSIENELGVRSTWNIVTNRYPVTRESLSPLAQSGEIGAHDTDHDGRLIFLSLGGCRKGWILMRLVNSLLGTAVPNFFEISRSRHGVPVAVGGGNRGACVASTGSPASSSPWPHSFRGRRSPCPRRRLDQRNRRPMHPFGTPRL